jgi:predicted flap endonuclease-1-like 5' DNA nuclease
VLWGKQIGILALYHDISELVHIEPVAPVETMFDEYTVAEDEATEVGDSEFMAEGEDLDEELDVAQEAMSKLAGKPMIEIEGIGPAYSEKLAAIGIETIDQYLLSTADKKGRKKLAEDTGISPKLVLEWANRADLMRVPGVGEEYSDLLEQAGVDTVKELKTRIPDHLHAAMVEINEQKNLVRRMPSHIEVTAWVEAAKQLPAILSY